ncbi:MAG TPA: aminotransferase class III-fold pyridoxal phosphate-dependent enzyme, partial [Gammaproteobacteria bacterium]|nr:aminotransferase class III-fold pyridoxal phosphate-dependent enzyme [Gammaproteobacteria bacterium]
AKSLGNGIPIGACLANGKAGKLFQPGNHGSTFGGNPLACHVACQVIDTLQDIDANQQATEMGDYLLSELNKTLGENDNVLDIRGLGLMLAIELDRPCPELVEQGIEAGLLINVSAQNIIRLLPPLILSRQQADELVDKLSHLISRFLLSY